MNITIIGSGNTATVLGKLLKQNNHNINEIAGRNKNSVQQLAAQLNADACIEINKLSNSSDVYIIAVRDNVAADVSNQLNIRNKVIVHTAGSVNMNVLKNASADYGVLYPLQSLRKELTYTPTIPFLIDGNNERSKQIILNLATSISRLVITANDDQRLQYHLSAIIVSNFTNHLFALAKDYCNKNEIAFDLLLPLIEETASRLHNYEPAEMQTGPAVRRDITTIEKHLQLLHSFPQLKNIYEMMSESIINYSAKK